MSSNQDDKKIIEYFYQSIDRTMPKEVSEVLDLDIVKDVGKDSNPSQDFLDSLRDLNESIFHGILVSMMKGYFFADISVIKSSFGKSISEQFPQASKEFINCANCYWTYKLRVEDISTKKNPDLISVQALARGERDIASVFFPTPGPMSISSKKREKAQRELLNIVIEKYKLKDFDLESYITGNPYLVKKKWGIF